MPKIPIYEPQVRPGGVGGAHPPKGLGLVQPEEMIQGQKGKAQVAGAAAKGLQAAGAIYGEAMGKQAQAQGSLSRIYDAVAQFGNNVADLGENIYKIEQTSRLTKNLTAADKELTEFYVGLSQKGDHKDTEKEWRENSQKIKDKYAKDLDGPYLDQYNSRFDGAAVSKYVQVAGMIHRFSVDQSMSGLVEARQWALQQLPQATINDQKRIRAEYEDDLDHAVANGVLEKTQAVQVRQAFRQEADFIDMKRTMEFSPDLAKKRLHEGAWPDLDPKLRTDYVETADRKIKENGFNGLFEQLMLDNRHDLEGLADNLKDEKYYTSIGLNAGDAYRMRGQVLAEINRDEAVDKEKIRVAGENELNQIYGAWSRGDVVSALTLVENSPFLKEKARMSLRSQIRKAAVTTDDADFGQAIIAYHSGLIDSMADLVKYRIMPDKYEYFSIRFKKREADKKGPGKGEGGLNYFNMAMEDYRSQALMQEDSVAGNAWRANQTKLAIALHMRLEQLGIQPTDPKAWDVYKELMAPDEEMQKGKTWPLWQSPSLWLVGAQKGKSPESKLFERVFSEFEGNIPRRGIVWPELMQPTPPGPTVKGQLYTRQYDSFINRYAASAKLSPDLVRAVIQTESNFNPSVVSPAGAVGLMQLMPATAIRMGVDNVYDPEQNIAGGVAYLKQMIDHFGSVELGLAAYNAGPGKVKNAGGIPDIAETKAFVKKVMSLYQSGGGTKYENIPQAEKDKIEAFLRENGYEVTPTSVETVYTRKKR